MKTQVLGMNEEDCSSFEQVDEGDSKIAVIQKVGKPYTKGRIEWIYYFGAFSGYMIEFDERGRVINKRLWVR